MLSHRESFLRGDLYHATQQVLAVRGDEVRDVENTALHLGNRVRGFDMIYGGFNFSRGSTTDLLQELTQVVVIEG